LIAKLVAITPISLWFMVDILYHENGDLIGFKVHFTKKNGRTNKHGDL